MSSPLIPDRQEERIRRALVAVDKLQRQLEQSERAQSEPIAIVGMACRFPGDSATPERYWDLLAHGVDAITPVPAGRWDTRAIYDPNPETPGKSYLTSGGFLREIDRFDADFFGIAPREAECIDPQHRMLLEVAWEALEDAGIPDLEGRAAGVFTGICLNDYASFQLNGADRTRITSYDGPGNAFCFASGRLSYFLGAHGPSLSVDTACSSALVAVHLACLSLRNRESEIALAGAVQLHLSPQTSIFLSRSKALAPDGRCKSFDAAADGFGRGEGCGVVVLKRLSDALTAGDPIHAVLRASAVNHDGRSSGLTVPNEAAQEKLIRQALCQAKIDPAAIDYIEAHGTGTVLGDPIEMAALQAVFGAGREKPLLVGSVKTNFGHLEAASGMAGLLKVVLALKNQQIPAHLHFRAPNPHIPWDRIPIEIPGESRPWRRGERPRLAGVSSFGFSGTNAHLVIEEAPEAKIFDSSAGFESAGSQEDVLTISAKSEAALRELAARYRDWLAGTTESWAAICHSARVGRAVFEHMLAVKTAADLDLFLEGQYNPSSTLISGSPAYTGPRVKLPSYPFQRRRYWVGEEAKAVPLVGKRLRKAGREIVFESDFGLGQPAFIGDHRVFGRPVMPLAAFLCMATEAAQQVLAFGKLEFTGIAVREPAILPEQGTRRFQTIFAPLDGGRYSLEIYSEETSSEGTSLGWALHVTGIVASHDTSTLHRQPSARLEPADVDALYDSFHTRGIEYGPQYRLIEALHAGKSRSQAHIGGGAGSAMLDACFQSLAAAFPALPAGATFLPVGICRLLVEGLPEGAVWCEAQANVTQGRELSGSLAIFDSSGTLLVEAEGFTSQLVTSGAETPAPTYVPVWIPEPAKQQSTPASADSIFFQPGPEVGQEDLPALCEDLLQQVRGLRTGSRLWIVTRGAQGLNGEPTNPWLSVFWGLGRTIANERPELRCTCVDLDPARVSDDSDDLRAELQAADDEDQVAYRGGVRYVLRLVRCPLSPDGCEQQRLTSTEPGSLDMLRFIPVATAVAAPGQVEIEVRAAGLNFKDVLYALGIVPWQGELPLGFECAGVIRSVGEGVEGLAPGDRVLSALSPGCLSQTVLADARFVVKLPSSLDFAEAATLPIAFLTARYALEDIARIQPGDRILIHAAAGGVGQAALQIAQRCGAIVFATASRPKWDLLRQQGVTNLYDSRTLAFADEILAVTQGEGVDIVLNSLKDDFIAASLRAMKRGGCFVEIGLSTGHETDCHRLQLGEVAEQQPERIRSLLEATVEEAARGQWKPLLREEFSFDRAPEAFRHMARANHSGKIVITVPSATTIRGAVLITGGLGALGLQVAERLASQGAEHLILASRSKPAGPVLPHLSAKVTVVIADIANENSVAALFAKLREDNIELRGVVHAAGVLRDGVLSGQSWASLHEVFAPKVYGAWNLHRQTQHLKLDFFVCFSSFAALYGSPGQGAYAAANSFLDALMQHRQQQGFPGLSINWGSWSGGGMAARMDHSHQGVHPLSPQRALSAFEALIRTSEAQAAVLDADWPTVAARMTRVPSLLRSLVQTVARAVQQEVSLEAQLQAVPVARRRAALTDFLKAQVVAVLRLDPQQAFQERKGFFDYGLDSLMAVELRNRLQTSTGKVLPTTLLFDAPNLYTLTDYFAAEFLPPAPAETEQEEAEEDIEVLLIRELLARELAFADAEGRHD